MISRKKGNSAGFTIVELMIATSVFTVVLLLLTFGLLQIGRVYYKGMVSVRTQNTARAISDDIVNSIQFGGGSVMPPISNTQCIGKKQYSFVIGSGDLISKKVVSACDGVFDNNADSADEQQLLPDNMRLANFEVTNVGALLYSVKVKVIYGADDLLIDSSGKKSTDAGFDIRTASCKGGAGEQFCAVSELFTNASKRI